MSELGDWKKHVLPGLLEDARAQGRGEERARLNSASPAAGDWARDVADLVKQVRDLRAGEFGRIHVDLSFIHRLANRLESLAAAPQPPSGERAAPYMPTADEAYRFIASNPITSAQFLVETQKLSRDDSLVSNGRLRDLWKLAGGMVDKKNKAWIEADLLPALLRIMIDGMPDEKTGERQALERQLAEAMNNLSRLTSVDMEYASAASRLAEINEIARDKDKRGWNDFDRIAALSRLPEERKP